LPEGARSKQSKVANSVLIAFRNVLRPAVYEFFQGALHLNLATHPFVFTPKADGSFSDPGDTTLRDRWTPYVTTGVLQKVPSVLERLNLDYPAAFLFLREHLFQLFNRHLRVKLTCSQRCAEKRDHCLPPRLH
jgi:hypothetical protein